jgi:hypothetical protein
MGELLAGPPAELLPPVPMPTAGATAPVHTMAERQAPDPALSLPPGHPRPWEEEQRQLPLI